MPFFKQINRLFNAYPYVSQGVVGGSFQVIGDVVAQKFIEKKENWDCKRTLNLFVAGYFTGLLLRKWYGVLQDRIKHPAPFVNAVMKVAVDQTIWAPASLFVCVGSVGFMQHRTLDGMVERLNSDFTHILMNNCRFWPPVQFFNFYFVPFNYQVALNFLVTVGRASYLSKRTHENDDESALEENDGNAKDEAESKQ